MAFATRLPKVRDHREHFNERTWIWYHQAPPWVRVVAHVGDAGQATPHLEHNPLSLLGPCPSMTLRKPKDPVSSSLVLTDDSHTAAPAWHRARPRIHERVDFT